MCARIVHLADYGGPYAGSFVPMLSALAIEAQRRGHDTSICFSDMARDRSWVAQLQQVTSVHFISAGHRPSVARDVRRLLGHRAEATVLHTHFGRFDVAAVLAAAGRPQTVVFWHKHNLLLSDPLVRARNTARFAVLGRRVAGALCVTPEIREAMIARRFPASKAHYFPNAIDLDRFPQITEVERATARERLELPSQAPVILHFAWDWLLKGGDLLLEVADRLAALLPAAVIATVLGERPPAEVLSSVRNHPSIRTLPPSPDVNAYYAAADLFLSTSRVEGINYAVLEALARGLPVVATIMPGQRAMIQDIPSCRVMADDPDRVAAAIAELLSLDSDRQAHNAMATRHALHGSFSLDPWVGRVLDHYQRALADA